MTNYKKTYTFPFKAAIPNYLELFLRDVNYLLLITKFFKRYFYLLFKGQLNKERSRIGDSDLEILWINISAPSIGDSLMDLSSRKLLKDRRVDLFTSEKNANIYKADLIFRKIYTESNYASISKKYDLVIIDSYSTRSVKIKSKICSKVNYVSMFGFFNGPEVNRVLFSYHRMNQLLGSRFSDRRINEISKPMMTISKVDINYVNKINLPKSFVCIALGGEWQYRTYQSWTKVIEKIFSSKPDENIILLGSANAKLFSNEITKKYKGNGVESYVDKLSFSQTAEIIRRSRLFICCDGGLMHAANSVNTPIIPLFARLTPEMQLTESITSYPLFDRQDVNNIPPERIFDKFLEASALISNKSKT